MGTEFIDNDSSSHNEYHDHEKELDAGALFVLKSKGNYISLFYVQ